MSRIGNQAIQLPKGVTVSTSGRRVTVKGPKGELSIEHRPEVAVRVDGAVVTVENQRPARDRHARAYHGLTRALLNNMAIGVTQGYEKKLEITGVGYQVKKQGDRLVFSLGFADDRVVEIPKGIEVDVPTATAIAVRGCDKQMVGELAARIRKLRPPEPYKGKGIKYDHEVIRRKAGKAFGSS
jgi:large subunit ribosomal protein L6